MSIKWCILAASLQGTAIITEDGDQIFWWVHRKTIIAEDSSGKRKGVAIVSFFTHSQKLSWINSMIVDDVQMDLSYICKEEDSGNLK